MEVTLDSTKQMFTPIKEGLGSTFTGAGNLFSNAGNALKDWGSTLQGGTTLPYYTGFYGYGFPFHHGCCGFYPGSIWGCRHGFWGIPTGVSHFTPIYMDPKPSFNLSSFADPTPPTVFNDNSSKYVPSKLPADPPSMSSSPWITPIFGASPDFYASLGLNPAGYTTGNSFVNPFSTPTFNGNQGMQGAPTSYQTPINYKGINTTIADLTPDMYLHPEKYAQQTTTQTQQQKAQTAKESAKTEAAANNYRTMNDRPLPTYMNTINNKLQNNGTLTQEQKALKKTFDAMLTEYSPCDTDTNGNWKKDISGAPQYNDRYEKMLQLSAMIEEDDADGIENFIDKTSPMELAAIEYYWEKIGSRDGKSELNTKPLREMIKDACNSWCWGLFRWTKWNGSKSAELLDKLDSKIAMVSPRNMADALYQALENHHMFGLGHNEDRVIKLLKMMEGKPEFSDAVMQEFNEKYKDNPRSIIVSTKWFGSQETKELAKKIFSGIK